MYGTQARPRCTPPLPRTGDSRVDERKCTKIKLPYERVKHIKTSEQQQPDFMVFNLEIFDQLHKNKKYSYKFLQVFSF